MSNKFLKIHKGLRLEPKASTDVALVGALDAVTTGLVTNLVYKYGTGGSDYGDLVVSNLQQTLTNKTLDSVSLTGTTTLDTTVKFTAATNRFAAVSLSSATNNTTATLQFIQTTDRSYTFPDANATLVGLDTAQTLSNKTFSDAPVLNGALDFEEETSLTNPSAGYRRIGFKTDGKLYFRNSAGTETSVSGTNSGDITLGAIGSSANANGATLTGQVLNLEPASGSFGGIVTTGTQSFAGFKTFLSALTLSGELIVSNSSIRLSVSTDSSTTGSAATSAANQAMIHRLTNASLVSLAGIDGNSTNSKFKYLVNETGSTITLLNESGSATATNRIITGTGGDITLDTGASLNLVYDSTSQRWRVAGGTGGGGSGANTALSNLSSVAINTSLISDTNNTDDLGSDAIEWKDVWAHNIKHNDATNPSMTIDVQANAGSLNLAAGSFGRVNLHTTGYPNSKISFLNQNPSTAHTTTISDSATSTITISLPTSSTTLVGHDTTNTLTNKTLSSPVLTGTVTTTSNEDITLSPDGTGGVFLTGDFTVANGITHRDPTDPTKKIIFDSSNALNTTTTTFSTNASSDITISLPDVTTELVGDNATQVLSNKIFSDAPKMNGAVDLEEETTVSAPSAGYRRIYTKTDGKIYSKDSSAVETLIGPQAVANDVVQTKSSTFTADVADDIYLVSTSGGNVTANLPTAVGNSGKKFKFKITTSGLTSGYGLTLDGNGTETIDGSTTRILYLANEHATIVSDGTNWQVVDHYVPSVWTSYTPTWTTSGTSPSIGNGTLSGMWRRQGDSIELQLRLVAGSTTTFGTGDFYLSLPSWASVDTAKLVTSGGDAYIAWGVILDSGTSRYQTEAQYIASNKVGFRASGTSGADLAINTTITGSVPMTWTTNDSLTVFNIIFPITNWW